MAQKHAKKVQELAEPRGLSESDTTLSRPNFDVTAYVSEKQKCRRKKYRKIFFDGGASFRIIPCNATIRQNERFPDKTFSCGNPLLGGRNHYTKQCEQYVSITSHDQISVYFANIIQLLSLV